MSLPMPNYLQRVVASGARTTALARPPATVAPLLPGAGSGVSARTGTAIDPESATELEEAVRQPDDAEPAGASGASALPVTDATELMRRVRALARGTDATVIRAPRGLRPPDAPAMSPLDPLTRDEASGSPPAEADGGSPSEDSMPERGGPTRAPARGGHSTATRATPAPSDDAAQPLLAPPSGVASSSATTGARAAAVARLAARAFSGAGTETSAGPTSLENQAEASSTGSSGHPAAQTELAPSPRPSRAPMSSSGPTARITIGRVEVEVHNETPAPAPVVRAAPLAPGPRLTSRFLLRP